MSRIWLFFLFFVCGVITSCSLNKRIISSTKVDAEGRTIAGDINVYYSTKSIFVADAGSRGGGHTEIVDVYKIQKGTSDERLPLNVKNLTPMLDNYAPAMEVIGKYKRIHGGQAVWRTANLLTLLGGVALIVVGTTRAAKGTGNGGGQLMGGFGVVFAASGSYWILSGAAKKNQKKLFEAIELYNKRAK
jgi:hypothetical protein